MNLDGGEAAKATRGPGGRTATALLYLLCPERARASLAAQLVKNLPAMRETWVQSPVGKIPWRRERLPTPVFWPGESMDCMVHGVAKSRTQLSDCHSLEHQGGPWIHIFSLFIYLAMPALGCSTQDLRCVTWNFPLQRSSSRVAAR